MEEVYAFNNNARSKTSKLFFLFDIELLNPHKDEESFRNKVDVIRQCVARQNHELIDLALTKKYELDKGLSPERIQQFLQFEADESHVGDQCQVCLEEVEVGRLIKQLDCGGRHSFCSVCIDTWFAEHKTCPICRHVFV